MTDKLSSSGYGDLAGGRDLTELNTSSFEDMANKALKVGEDIQADFERKRDLAMNETDPVKKALYTNTNNEAVNALTIQIQLNFLRVGAELMKLPGVLKNG
jgi:hypothetical protein